MSHFLPNMEAISGRFYILGLAIVALVLAACRPEMEIVEVSLDPPLERLVVRGQRFVFYPAADSRWEELVKIELFEGLRPSMTLEEIIECMGAPSEREDDLYVAYARPQGHLTMSHESDRSLGATFSTWRLRLYPSQSSLQAIFHPAVIAQLEQELSGRAEIVIMSSTNDGPALTALLQSKRVQSLTWHPYGQIAGGSGCP
jgi:hypothetical protein